VEFFRAPVIPALPAAPGMAGDATASNIYAARFVSRYPGPNFRFLN
jgi:hypothetical protein